MKRLRNPVCVTGWLVFFSWISLGNAVLRAENPTHWWARDDSVKGSVRIGEVRRACKVETAGDVVRLYCETGGKLVMYWESADAKCAKAVRQQMVWAPSVFTPMGNDAFISKDAIGSVEFKKAENGAEVCVVRGLEVDLGTISDAAAIKILKGQLAER